MNSPAGLDLKRLRGITDQLRPETGHSALIGHLNELDPQITFSLVFSRSGWHRSGGLVDASGNSVTRNLDEWLAEQGFDDPQQIYQHYHDAGLQVTRLNGVSHYLTARYGDAPEEFIQLELDEVQEVIERPLVDPEWIAESIEELLEPTEYITSTPQPSGPRPVGTPRYLFRRATAIAEFLYRASNGNGEQAPISRFFCDWRASSAGDSLPIEQQWVMALREYEDPYGEPIARMTPFPVDDELPELDPDASFRGSRLAQAIHDFDRTAGYPMAWFFFMLVRKKVSPVIAEAIHNDLVGAYDYLPARDLQVLNAWTADPYHV